LELRGEAAVVLRARSALLWLLLAYVALGVASCGLGALLLKQPSIDDQLTAARARWATRPFSNYRLVVEEQINAGRCGQDVRVQDEQIREVFGNGCVRQANWTIDNLFTWAEQHGDYKSRCYPSDVTCVCFSIYTTHVSFDPQLGYPQSVTYPWELEPNWGYANHWRRLWLNGELPTCRNISRRAGDHITVTVVTLTPLP
jgi:Family of unknown function (DUF6174)